MSQDYELGTRRPEAAYQEEIIWGPACINDGENRGFRTGCPVFTDLWSYVLEISDYVNVSIQKKSTHRAPKGVPYCKK
jgi:hypothetical protein